ncbi:hypothetical protein HPP92_004114 [Vanilla planifolia]|uniref:65-kDa microtubule-associated protein 3 n=1 Tax=Vanilla planifolia TaxID=51239 RepID=A0A835SGW8_VANPL|nr:hypothetical protein HPP92_004114 [Vanilla planifolia]
MSSPCVDQLSQIETTCGSLLYELQMIWDEIGEPDAERDKTIFELEQECLEVYRRKVDQANHSRAFLRQTIADVESELASICSSMGERPLPRKKSQQNAMSLKEELKAITPQLEEMRKRKNERFSQFLQVIEQIRKISSEIHPYGHALSNLAVDESDLSTRTLEDFQRLLETLQKEKADRLKKVLEHLGILKALCIVLGMDFRQTVVEVHPSLDEAEGLKIVTNDVIERLASMIHSLREVKMQRMQKLQDLATSMLELWNLMDTPIEEQQLFQNVTCNIAASEDEITEANTLSTDFLNYVESEVVRLEELKASKMKELVLKKKTELEELRHRTHLITKGDDELEIAIDAVETGAIDPSLILEQIEEQISAVKEEAFSRKDILERVEKWLNACEEEAWLEEYNRDENRYTAVRGAHLTLKRAEKARATVQRIPGLVEALCNKVIAWEKERGTIFKYDGVRLLSMLEEYNFVRQEKEEERRRQRDQKKLQSQIIAEQEALFGSKPSPSRPQLAKKVPRTSYGGASRRLSLGAAASQPARLDSLHGIKATNSTKKIDERTFVSPAKKLSFNSSINSSQTETPRKPLNSMNANTDQTETPRKPFATRVCDLQMTPTLPVGNNILDEENQSPAATLISALKTPGTVSTPMQMAATPASFFVAHDSPAAIPRAAEELEYSFEERRLAFYLKRGRI